MLNSLAWTPLGRAFGGPAGPRTDLQGAASGHGGGYGYCPEGVPVEFALLSLLGPNQIGSATNDNNETKIRNANKICLKITLVYSYTKLVWIEIRF